MDTTVEEGWWTCWRFYRIHSLRRYYAQCPRVLCSTNRRRNRDWECNKARFQRARFRQIGWVLCPEKRITVYGFFRFSGKTDYMGFSVFPDPPSTGCTPFLSSINTIIYSNLRPSLGVDNDPLIIILGSSGKKRARYFSERTWVKESSNFDRENNPIRRKRARRWKRALFLRKMWPETLQTAVTFMPRESVNSGKPHNNPILFNPSSSSSLSVSFQIVLFILFFLFILFILFCNRWSSSTKIGDSTSRNLRVGSQVEYVGSEK